MTPPARRGSAWLVAAATLGLVHAAVSLYWALGGTWLLDTLGARLVETFAGARLLLLPVAAVKAAVALGPLLLARRDGIVGRASRLVGWLAAGALVVWGGLNTVVGNLVLAGVVRPDGGYDRPGMIGHAWLWDPLFLAWGLALGAGLLGTASRRNAPPRRRA